MLKKMSQKEITDFCKSTNEANLVSIAEKCINNFLSDDNSAIFLIDSNGEFFKLNGECILIGSKFG